MLKRPHLHYISNRTDSLHYVSGQLKNPSRRYNYPTPLHFYYLHGWMLKIKAKYRTEYYLHSDQIRHFGPFTIVLFRFFANLPRPIVTDAFLKATSFKIMHLAYIQLVHIYNFYWHIYAIFYGNENLLSITLFMVAVKN